MRALLVLAVGAVTVTARAQVAERSSPSSRPVTDDEFAAPVDQSTAREIDDLIPRLGHPEYTIREQATTRLTEIGIPAFAPLRAAYANADELEVRLRIERIVHAAYIEHHVYGQKGFLGVGVRPYGPPYADEPPLPGDVQAVRLTQVHEGTAAALAGLHEQDLVTAMDGRRLEGRGLELVEDFSARIAARRPGESMVLTIIRDFPPIDVEVILGRCPTEIARMGRVRAINEGLEEANERFKAWWWTYFHPPEDDLPGTGDG
jgi:predicted metalloprotease with PDZ domain